jgi:hypothetical protein
LSDKKWIALKMSYPFYFLVPEVGVEPTCPEERGILRAI